METMNRHSGSTPEITTVEDMLAKMRAGTKEVHEIRMRELVIPVRILSIDEMNEIRREALRETMKIQGDDVDKNVKVQKYTLKMASSITKGGAPILSDRFLGVLSVDEVNYLYDEYIRVSDTVNPSLEAVTPDQFRSLVEALKKNTITGKDCSLRQLRAICTAYVDLIQRQVTQSSPQDS